MKLKSLLLSIVLISTIFVTVNAENNNIRLHSDTLDVLNYNINLDISDYASNTLTGFTTLKIVPKIENFSVVNLDLLALTVDSVKVNDVTNIDFTNIDTLLSINLLSPFSTTDTFFVTVFYHGIPEVDPSGWGGFDFANNIAYNLGVGFDIKPHVFGRAWYPCIDDFIDRATYDYHITTAEDNKAICGGTLISEIDNGNGTKTFHWNMKDEIPTYLSSVAVGNYIAVTDTFNGLNGDIPIAIYVNPSDSMDAVNSFINLKEITAAYEDRFGPYMWERIGYVGTPQGAMEHVANIAYPYGLIDGSLTYEWLYAHELAHHWFGDLVTCQSAEDMWLNEGWAVFSEAIYKEALHGKEAYKLYTRKNHREVLRKAHITDNGYMALYGIPHEYTYGTTVYDKGGDVTHSLRGYLGDDVFFDAVKAYMNEFAFKDASTAQQRDFFSTHTGVELTDFYDFWVYHPGFTHYSVDSFNVVNNGLDYDVEVFALQRLRGATMLANSNNVEITFMNDNWETYTDFINFSGETGSETFTIPFNPSVVMLDIDEKLSDATTDNYKVINEPGEYTYESTYFRADVSAISDSSFLRVEHNWVKADTLNITVPGLFLSEMRYWKIDGIIPDNFDCMGRFEYYKSASYYLDNELMTNSTDSLVLLYRPNVSEDWEIFPTTKSGSSYTGKLITETLPLGEYVFGMKDWNQYIGIKNIPSDDKINIYPNPSNDTFNIEYDIKSKGSIDIYNIHGQEVYKKKLNSEENLIKWSPKKNKKGIYLITIREGDKIIGNKKVILN